MFINKEYSANPEKFDKLIISLRTAYVHECSLDKEQTSYDDSLDALRLLLKGYKIRKYLVSKNNSRIKKGGLNPSVKRVQSGHE